MWGAKNWGPTEIVLKWLSRAYSSVICGHWSYNKNTKYVSFMNRNWTYMVIYVLQLIYLCNVWKFFEMCENNPRKLMRAWCVIEKKMREKHAKCVKVGRSVEKEKYWIWHFSFPQDLVITMNMYRSYGNINYFVLPAISMKVIVDLMPRPDTSLLFFCSTWMLKMLWDLSQNIKTKEFIIK